MGFILWPTGQPEQVAPFIVSMIENSASLSIVNSNLYSEFIDEFDKKKKKKTDFAPIFYPVHIQVG